MHTDGAIHLHEGPSHAVAVHQLQDGENLVVCVRLRMCVYIYIYVYI